MLKTIAPGSSSPRKKNGRPVPFALGALPEHVGRRTREDSCGRRCATPTANRAPDRALKSGAASEAEIDRIFRTTPAPTRVFPPRRTRQRSSRRATRILTPQTHHARRIRRMNPDGPWLGLRRGPQLPLVQERHAYRARGRSARRSNPSSLDIRHRPDHLGLTPCSPCPSYR